MTFPRQNILGWALFEELTSAQQNGIDLNLTHALDAEHGGSYIMAQGVRGDGFIRLDFTAVGLTGNPIEGDFHIVRSASSNIAGLSIDGSKSTVPDQFALFVDNVTNYGGVTSEMHAAGFSAAGFRGIGVQGGGGQGTATSDGRGGEGLVGIGGSVSSGTTGFGISGGDGVQGTGGDSDNTTDLDALAGRGGKFVAGSTSVAGRDGAPGVVGIGGIADDSVGGPGGEFLGGISASGNAGDGIRATGADHSAGIAGIGAVIRGGISTGAAAPFAGLDVIGGGSTTASVGGIGAVIQGGVGNTNNGLGLLVLPGVFGGGSAAALEAIQDEGGRGIKITPLSGATGDGLVISRNATTGYALLIGSGAGTPVRAAVNIAPTPEPSNSLDGDLYFDSVTGRCTVFADDRGDGGTTGGRYEKVPSGNDAPIFWGIYTSAAGTDVIDPVKEDGKATGTVALIATDSIFSIGWSTNFVDTDYCVQLTAFGTNPQGGSLKPAARATNASDLQIEFYDAGVQVNDLDAEAWRVMVTVWSLD